MPSRTLRDSIISSPSLARCAAGAQDRFPRYLLAADDFGCFDVNTVALRGRLYPHRPDITAEAISADIDDYHHAGMLELWSEGARTFAFFLSWGRHQRVREEGEFRSKRKTPVPPSMRPYPSLKAYYAASADRAVEAVIAAQQHPTTVSKLLPGNPLPGNPEALPGSKSLPGNFQKTVAGQLTESKKANRFNTQRPHHRCPSTNCPAIARRSRSRSRSRM